MNAIGVVDALGSVAARNAGPFPHGLTATLVERQVGGYQIGYRKDSSESTADYYLSVRPSPPFASDYWDGAKFVARGGRRCAIEGDASPVAGQELRAAVSFEFGEYTVSFYGPGKPEAVLALAAQIGPATPEGWRGTLRPRPHRVLGRRSGARLLRSPRRSRARIEDCPGSGGESCYMENHMFV